MDNKTSLKQGKKS